MHRFDKIDDEVLQVIFFSLKIFSFLLSPGPASVPAPLRGRGRARARTHARCPDGPGGIRRRSQGTAAEAIPVVIIGRGNKQPNSCLVRLTPRRDLNRRRPTDRYLSFYGGSFSATGLVWGYPRPRPP